MSNPILILKRIDDAIELTNELEIGDFRERDDLINHLKSARFNAIRLISQSAVVKPDPILADVISYVLEDRT